MSFVIVLIVGFVLMWLADRAAAAPPGRPQQVG